MELYFKWKFIKEFIGDLITFVVWLPFILFFVGAIIGSIIDSFKRKNKGSDDS